MMTIQLTDDLQGFIREQVHLGGYPSEEAVVRDALDRLRNQLQGDAKGLGSIGLMRDAASELDEIVEAAMRRREGGEDRTQPGQSLWGMFREEPELIDAIVRDAMHDREVISMRDEGRSTRR